MNCIAPGPPTRQRAVFRRARTCGEVGLLSVPRRGILNLIRLFRTSRSPGVHMMRRLTILAGFALVVVARGSAGAQNVSTDDPVLKKIWTLGMDSSRT